MESIDTDSLDSNIFTARKQVDKIFCELESLKNVRKNSVFFLFELICNLMQKNNFHSLNKKDLVQRQFLVSRLVRENDRNEWNFNIKAIKRHIVDIMEFPLFERSDRFDKPTLFVRGEMSNYVT